MPKAIKKRIPKKSSDTETEVQEKLSSIKDTLRERQRTVLKLSVVALVAIAAVVGLLVYSSVSAKKAKTLADEGYEIFYRTPQAANKEEGYNKALELFKQSYDTRKSPYALYYIAAAYYELGKYDDAVKTLKDFTRSYPNDGSFTPLAYQKMALIYIRKGDTEEAKKALDQLLNLKGDLFKDLALMEYAGLLEKEGKAEEAKKKYDELVKRFPNSPYKETAEAKLGGKKEG